MPRPAHHTALASYDGKIYVCGGFVAPEKSPLPIGAAIVEHRRVHRAPVVVVDLAEPDVVRWPAYGPAMLAHQIRGVYAMPVVVAGQCVGALDLFRAHPGVLGAEQLAGALVAAELAQMPLLDLLAEDLRAAVADPDSDSWAELAGRGESGHRDAGGPA